MKKYWIASVALFVADQITKYWAEARLMGQTIDFWPGIMRFRYARNTGAAFSIFHGNSLMLAAITLCLIVVVMFVYFREKSLSRLSRGGLALICMGGLGNLVDRLARGYVVDFVEPVFVSFAIFNIADVMVCLGAALVALGVIMKGGGENANDG